MKNKFLFIFIALATFTANAVAQEKLKETKIPVDMSIEVKNAHIWRGLDVTHNSLIDADLRIIDKSKTFAFGVWGATTFTNDFREFDYYVGFYKGRFSLEVWDVYNFSEKNSEAYNTDKAFDYGAHTTGHFVDVRLAYTISESFPLRLGWNTIVFGRDRVKPSPLTSASSARYSTYVEAEYPVMKGQFVDVSLGIAGAFALVDAKVNGKKVKGHFYGDSNGIVSTTLKVSKAIKFSDSYTLPVTAIATWNPEASKTYLELSAKVLQF